MTFDLDDLWPWWPLTLMTFDLDIWSRSLSLMTLDPDMTWWITWLMMSWSIYLDQRSKVTCSNGQMIFSDDWLIGQVIDVIKWSLMMIDWLNDGWIDDVMVKWPWSAVKSDLFKWSSDLDQRSRVTCSNGQAIFNDDWLIAVSNIKFWVLTALLGMLKKFLPAHTTSHLPRLKWCIKTYR